MKLLEWSEVTTRSVFDQSTSSPSRFTKSIAVCTATWRSQVVPTIRAKSLAVVRPVDVALLDHHEEAIRMLGEHLQRREGRVGEERVLRDAREHDGGAGEVDMLASRAFEKTPYLIDLAWGYRVGGVVVRRGNASLPR
jgi:hypothetical protein